MTGNTIGKTLLVAALVLLLIGLAGCGRNDDSTLNVNFKQGVQELEFRLIENAPPEKIYPLSTFSTIIDAKNMMGYDATGTVQIVGLVEKYFQPARTEESFQLEGRTPINPKGGQEFFEFSVQAQDLEQGAVEYRNNYFLLAEYRSSMEFSDTICINPRFYDVYSGGCTVENRKTYAGQGSPLAVTELEEIITPLEKAEFRLLLKNRGKGKVKSVSMGNARLGNEELACVFKGGVGIVEQSVTFTPEKQEAVIICSAPLASSDAYVTTVSIPFEFDYEVSQRHTLKMVR